MIRLRFAAVNCYATAASEQHCKKVGASTFGRHSTSTFDVRLYGTPSALEGVQLEDVRKRSLMSSAWLRNGRLEMNPQRSLSNSESSG